MKKRESLELYFILLSLIKQNIRESGKSSDLAKVTADGDCSHEIKTLAHLKETYENLDSILKSRDITLPTKVHIVKAMVFPAVMYRYESWTIKKAEH